MFLPNCFASAAPKASPKDASAHILSAGVPGRAENIGIAPILGTYRADMGKPLGFFAKIHIDSETKNKKDEKACFGLNDDGLMDGAIWKVRQPAGSLDYVNCNFGTTTADKTITAIEIASWNLCGSTQCWGSVGLYAGNLGVDPSGNTPDPASPISSAPVTIIAPFASDWT